MTGDAIINGISVDAQDLMALRSRLKGMTLRQLRRQRSISSGSKQTRIRGRGMEYEESRAYVVGDDVKTMDWRVMARTGEAHTKVFAEEKERSLILAIDLSSSMFFGTKTAFKSWAAAQLTAHLGWLANFAGDRLGAIVASTDNQYLIRPAKGQAALIALFHRLTEACRQDLPIASEPGRLNTLLTELKHAGIPGSTVVLISDFLGVDDITIKILQSLSKNHNLVAFWISDRSETEPWAAGSYAVAVNSENIVMNTDNEVSQAWITQQQQNHRSNIVTLTSELNITLHEINCNDDITAQLANCLS